MEIQRGRRGRWRVQDVAVKDFRELKVWQRSHVTFAVYQVTESFPLKAVS